MFPFSFEGDVRPPGLVSLEFRSTASKAFEQSRFLTLRVFVTLKFPQTVGFRRRCPLFPELFGSEYQTDGGFLGGDFKSPFCVVDS